MGFSDNLHFTKLFTAISIFIHACMNLHVGYAVKTLSFHILSIVKFGMGCRECGPGIVTEIQHTT